MLTQAQQDQNIKARFAVRDAIKHIPVSELPELLAKAMLAHYKPEVVQAIGDNISRHAHYAGRV